MARRHAQDIPADVGRPGDGDASPVARFLLLYFLLHPPLTFLICNFSRVPGLAKECARALRVRVPKGIGDSRLRPCSKRRVAIVSGVGRQRDQKRLRLGAALFHDSFRIRILRGLCLLVGTGLFRLGWPGTGTRLSEGCGGNYQQECRQNEETPDVNHLNLRKLDGS